MTVQTWTCWAGAVLAVALVSCGQDRATQPDPFEDLERAASAAADPQARSEAVRDLAAYASRGVVPVRALARAIDLHPELSRDAAGGLWDGAEWLARLQGSVTPAEGAAPSQHGATALLRMALSLLPAGCRSTSSVRPALRQDLLHELVIEGRGIGQILEFAESSLDDASGETRLLAAVFLLSVGVAEAQALDTLLPLLAASAVFVPPGVLEVQVAHPERVGGLLRPRVAAGDARTKAATARWLRAHPPLVAVCRDIITQELDSDDPVSRIAWIDGTRLVNPG